MFSHINEISWLIVLLNSSILLLKFLNTLSLNHLVRNANLICTIFVDVSIAMSLLLHLALLGFDVF